MQKYTLFPSVGSDLILDRFTGAGFAFSHRKLRTGVTNGGRARRSYDSNYLDVGFSGVDMNTAALSSWAIDNVFYEKMYDQSGNGRDVSQSNASKQPSILISGIISTTNGKPCLKFGSGILLKYVGSTGLSTNGTLITVSKMDSTSGYAVIASVGDTNTANSYCHLGWIDGNRGVYDVNVQSINGPRSTNQEVWASKTASGSTKLWVNGVLKSITNSSHGFTADMGKIYIGNDDFNSYLNGSWQESIYWPYTMSDADLLIAMGMINSYYNAY